MYPQNQLFSMGYQFPHNQTNQLTEIYDDSQYISFEDVDLQCQDQAYFPEQPSHLQFVENIEERPYRCIGLIEGKLNNDRVFGSGCLVAPNMVLSCAHNHYSRRDKLEIGNLTFTIYYNNSSRKVDVLFVLYPQQFRNDEKTSPNDYSIFVLADSFDSYLQFQPKNVKPGQLIRIIGYPKIINENKKIIIKMQKTQGQCKQTQQSFIKYKFPTTSGYSGAPILNQHNHIIGIHIGSQKAVKRNIGIRFNYGNATKIQKWRCYLRQGRYPSKGPQLFREEIRNFSIPQVPEHLLHDRRQWVRETRFFPYSAIGRVRSKFTDENKDGTGCIVGNKFILTAGHICFNKQRNQQAQSVTFIPIMNGQNNYQKQYQVKRYYLYPQYRQIADKNKYYFYDFALLELEQRIDDKYGCFGMDFLPNSVDMDTKLQICGYPKDRGHTMWTAQGNIVQLDEKLIKSKISTSKGQGGSPIFKRVKNKVFLVGIHIGHYDSIKLGIRLRGDIVETLKGWLNG